MKISYRPEIDGLRAVAVISVILYHTKNYLGFTLFSWGFIDVDIFFVISGYLISSIIFKELITTGNFSFKNFYERRIRRILPALLFVIFVSLILGTILLLPNNFVEFQNHFYTHWFLTQIFTSGILGKSMGHQKDFSNLFFIPGLYLLKSSFIFFSYYCIDNIQIFWKPQNYI